MAQQRRDARLVIEAEDIHPRTLAAFIGDCRAQGMRVTEGITPDLELPWCVLGSSSFFWNEREHSEVRREISTLFGPKVSSLERRTGQGCDDRSWPGAEGLAL